MKTETRFWGLCIGAWLLVAIGAASCTGKAGQTQTCAMACGPGQMCQAGQCVCSAGLLSCGGNCVASNAAHCGNCDTLCNGTDVCNAGMCQSMCPPGTTQCGDGQCVDPTMGDVMHCGGCNPCPSGASCIGGVCMSPTGMGGMSGAGGSTGSGGTGGGTVACDSLPAIPRRLWRLSVEQWGAAVKDLLGLSTAPVLTARGGEAARAFFSDVANKIDADFQFALYQSSQNDVLPAIMSRIGASGTTGLATCTATTTAAYRTCATTFIQSFAAKGFRRPVDTTDVNNLLMVYDTGAGTGTTVDYPTGISLVIQAVITSPSFVYRTELGPTTLAADASGNYPDTTLNPYEIASQLGFLFLGSLPDSGLTAAAADGSIATTTGLSAQIDRLLALPAVKANLVNIMVDWFNVRQMFDRQNKDTSLLSALATADQDQGLLTNDLYTATQQFVNDVLWTSKGSMNDLVMSNKVYMNKRLATLYPGATFSGGAPSSNTTFVAGSWPSSQGRSGLLTQPAFLWSASDPAKTSIVKRGKFIHDDIVCQDAVPPAIDLSTPQALAVIACMPPSTVTCKVDADCNGSSGPAPCNTTGTCVCLPDTTGQYPNQNVCKLSACDSEILQSDARMAIAPCKSCHPLMDPYARVLQNFGPIGNYRTVDEANRTINASVSFTMGPLNSQTVNGSVQFGQALASTGVIRDCSVQKITSYALGSMIRTYNTCEVNNIRTQTDGTIASLFKQVAMANILRARQGGAK